jgi:hypothetical protein
LRPKIGAILKVRFSPTAIPTYQGGAAHAQAVGRHYQAPMQH